MSDRKFLDPATYVLEIYGGSQLQLHFAVIEYTLCNMSGF
jgi:hypothetical protein